MKRFYPYLVALALMSGGAVYGSAQTAYGQPNFGVDRQPYQTISGNGFFDHGGWGRDDWNEGRRVAQDQGFRDGTIDGRKDWDRHAGFRPTHNESYKHADRGYDRHFGDKGRYKEEYRQAYTRGYEDAYRGHGHGPGRYGY